MAKGKLVQSEANVHRLLNDKDAMRKMVENAIQNIVKEEFEEHMGRKPYERGKGLSTHRNSFKERTLTTPVQTAPHFKSKSWNIQYSAIIPEHNLCRKA